MHHISSRNPILEYSFIGFFLMCFGLSTTAQTWETLNVNSLSWRFEDIYFVNPETGWAVDGGGQIIKTTDGGQNWTQQFLDSNLYFRSVEFLNEQVGYAGTLANGNPNAQLLKTTDGGDSWTDITGNFPTNVQGICGISVVDANTVFITGIFFGSAYVMKSTDGGATWQYMSMLGQANGLVDIFFKDANEGFAVGQSAPGTGLRAVVLGTTDGGSSWNILATGNHDDQRSWKLQMLDENIMYASIEEFEPSPQYFKSTDGGTTWQLTDVETTNTSGTMQGIGFLNEQLGWIGGFSELFYETEDGGATWEYQPTIGQSFNRFFRVNDTLMYSSGLQIYRYADETLGIDDIDLIEPAGHSIWVEPSVITKDIATIKMKLVNNTWAELSAYNIMGQRVQTIDQGTRNSGDHEILWNTSSLTSGHYFLVLYTYHGYESIRVVID